MQACPDPATSPPQALLLVAGLAGHSLQGPQVLSAPGGGGGGFRGVALRVQDDRGRRPAGGTRGRQTESQHLQTGSWTLPPARNINGEPQLHAEL